MRVSLVLVFLGGVATMAGTSTACSTSSGGGSSPDGGTVVIGDAGSPFALGVPCTDTVDSVYGDPGDVSAQHKGAILKCAHDQDIPVAMLESLARAGDDAGSLGYSGKAFTSGAHVYRVLYRTERGDSNNTPGYSSALVLLPDTPRATQLPVVVASHGSRGQAAACAPSEDSAAGAYVQSDFIHQVYPLVGLGFAVIAPDLAGYANFGGPNNPPSAYADTADVGKSTLDGARALRQIIPNGVTQQVVLVGHSQGGHTTLSALSMADSYGADGVIAAVAVYAPLWWSQRAWVALFIEPGNYALDHSSAGPVSIWYHYTHGELLDGPGHGVDLFQTAQQPVVKGFVNNDCWSASYPDLEDAGTSANDFFVSSYVNTMPGAALTDQCPTDADGGVDPTCQTWLDRMTADWPHLNGGAQQVPTLVLYANNDTTITPDLAACVVRRLNEDGVNYTSCYDPHAVGHSGVVSENAGYVSDWIANKTLGGPTPTPSCMPFATDDAGTPVITDDAGAPVPCNPLLPDK